jgi:hypothetical protein
MNNLIKTNNYDLISLPLQKSGGEIEIPIQRQKPSQHVTIEV